MNQSHSPSGQHAAAETYRDKGTRGKRRHGACGGRATSGIAHTRQNIASAEASTSELCVWRASAPVTPSSGVRYQHTYQSWGSTPVQRSADRRNSGTDERTTTVPVKMPREDDGARDARQGASGRHAEGESPKRDVNQPPSKPRGKRSLRTAKRSAGPAGSPSKTRDNIHAWDANM